MQNRTYHFFNDMINIKNFDSNLLQIDKKLHKNIGIYYIECITIKKINDYENIWSINPLYLILGEVDRYIEESNGNKHLVFASTDENKEVLKRYTEFWNEIKNEIEAVNGGKTGKHKKDFMKIKFDSDDNLLLDRIFKLRMLAIVFISVFEEDGQFYPQVYLY